MSFVPQFVTVSFDFYYPINLVTTFSWPPTRDTRNDQMLVICHTRSLNLTLKKKVKAQKKNHKSVKSPIKKLLVLKKKVKTQQKKSQSCEITDKNIISIFFRSTRIIRSISDSFFEPISYGPDNPCAKKILIINIYLKIFYFLHEKKRCVRIILKSGFAG